jgi:sorbitol-specific phosphotransferase system component IIA
LPTRGRIEDDVVAVMNALCDGPRTPGAISAIPEDTRARTAFVDPATGHVVIEFNRELAARHPGGSAAEYATLTVLLKTLALNFPEFSTCSLLVDGAQVETLGGHLQADEPFALRRWR